MFFRQSLMVLPIWLSGCVATTVNQSVEAPDTAVVESVNEVITEAKPLSADFVYEYLLSDIAARRGFADESVQALVRLAQSSRDTDIVRRAFRLAMHGKYGDIALQMAELLGELEPTSMRAVFSRVQALMLLERSEEGIALISQLLSDPSVDVARVFNNASEVFARQPEPGKYIEAFKQLSSQFPDNSEAFYALAYLASRGANMPVLKQSINRALQLRPDWQEAALVNFSYLVNQDTWRNVKKFVDGFLARNPDADDLRGRFGRYMVGQRQMSEAQKHFSWLIRKNPQNSEALLAGAIVRMQLQQYPVARRYLQRYLKIKPTDDQARLYLGQVEMDSEDYIAAVDWFSRIRDERYYMDAQIRIGTAIREIDGIDAALNHLYELIPANSEEEVQIYLAQERFLRDSGRFDEAKRLMDAAIQELPDNSELHYSRALLAAELNLLELHESDIRRVIELDPDNAHAYNALGYTLADQTPRVEEAFKLITHALSLAPDDPFILDSMGWVNFRLGRLKEAINYLRRAISIRQDAEIAAHLGEVLWVDGQQNEAEEVWRKSIDKYPQNQTLKSTLKRLKQQ
ncbi:MAG: tetratricopeptide (TPR) repeat protein [Parasphingorhabdus sp.]|jgi:tetratricopeptide (TPR) repeat protein